MNRILKILTVVLLMAFAPASVFAQSASESYENGLALMKKRDYAGAIPLFRRSMTMNKSAENVKKCKAQIAKCQKNLKQKPSTPAAPQKTLTIANPTLSIPANPDRDFGVQINVTPESNDWIANVDGNIEWLELSKSMDGKYLVVKAAPTDKTIVRHATIVVRYDNITRTVHVSQAGKEVELTASELFVKFKKKSYLCDTNRT